MSRKNVRLVNPAAQAFGSAFLFVVSALSASLSLPACILPSTRAGDASMADGGAPADAGLEAGTGMDVAAGSKRNAATIDPTIEWMCTKNTKGECTSCKQDTDCQSHVCERGYCMDCRDVSQCGAADSCIANRCVPERKPTSVWATSGGGQTGAVGFKLQVSIGVPAPAATASAAGFKLSVAPGAGSF